MSPDIYELVKVKWIHFPKKSIVNLSKENAILRFTNGKSVKFYNPYLTKGLTKVTIGTEFHLIYFENGENEYGKEYEVVKAISLKDKDLLKFIKLYNPSETILEKYLFYGLEMNHYGDQEYSNWLCDNVLNIPRNNDERMMMLLYCMINSDPLKKAYDGYNFNEVKNVMYDKIKNNIEDDFNIEKAWNKLIGIKSGRYVMFEGRRGEGYYFPSQWTD